MAVAQHLLNSIDGGYIFGIYSYNCNIGNEACRIIFSPHLVVSTISRLLCTLCWQLLINLYIFIGIKCNVTISSMPMMLQCCTLFPVGFQHLHLYPHRYYTILVLFCSISGVKSFFGGCAIWTWLQTDWEFSVHFLWRFHVEKQRCSI